MTAALAAKAWELRLRRLHSFRRLGCSPDDLVVDWARNKRKMGRVRFVRADYIAGKCRSGGKCPKCSGDDHSSSPRLIENMPNLNPCAFHGRGSITIGNHDDAVSLGFIRKIVLSTMFPASVFTNVYKIRFCRFEHTSTTHDGLPASCAC